MSFDSQAIIPNTPASNNSDDDASSEVASTVLSTSSSVATPTTNHHAQVHEVEGIPCEAARLTYLGRSYVYEQDLARRRNRTSWVWRHGVGLINAVSGIRFWKCSECRGPLILRAHSTDHLMKHLEKKHRLGPNGRVPASTPFH